jgi:hypothetical protein
MRFESVWYASEAKVRSRSKFIAFDDTGTINLFADAIVFRGRRTRVEVLNVAEPRLVRQSWPWTSFIIVNLVVLPAHLFFLGALRVGILPWLPILIIGVNALAASLGRSVKWVVATGRMDGGVVARCYFADGSAFGWGGVFGGTKRLHRSLRDQLLNTDSGAMT